MTAPVAPARVAADVELAVAGDEAAFERLVAPLRRELRAHAYRMLGSIHDAEDAVQEGLLRAWRGLPGFAGRSSLRTWLYTVTTRTCLDLVDGRGRRALPMDLGPASAPVVDDVPRADVPWLEPWPGAGPDGAEPGARYEQREAVELAFVAALQHLPGNQRAALLLFEVLGYSAAEIAAIMVTSVASVNSALQRARQTLAERLPTASQQDTLRRVGDDRIRDVVAAYATALERRDVGAFVALLTDDVTWAMPPMPHWCSGKADVAAFATQVPFGGCGEWRSVPVTVNAQPGLAHYLNPTGTDPAAGFAAWSITVITLREDRIAGLTSFLGAKHFQACGLPLRWAGS